MQRCKQIISALLSALLCLSLLAPAALAEEERTAEPELNMEMPAPEPPETPDAPPMDAQTENDDGAEAPDGPEPPEELDEPDAAPEAPEGPETPELPDMSEEETAHPAITVRPELEPLTAEDEDWPDNDELFAGYVDRVLYGGAGMELFSMCVGDHLTGPSRVIYDRSVAMARQVAAGERESTVITVTLAEMGVAGRTWTAADLGMTTLVENGKLTNATVNQAYQAIFGMNRVLSALLADCSYELYWFDKTTGGGIRPGGILFVAEYDETLGEYVLRLDGELTLGFSVAQEYSVTGSKGATVADVSVGAAVAAARQNAAAIVSRYAGASDYTKLRSYMLEICELVSYDSAAAGAPAGTYGNPWQLIWVFDDDPATNVVCEGYSKAFRYLCDMTAFDGDITCYTVTGGIPGAHMWNIVSIEGTNYLVDVTNCDGGNVGAPDKLFLAGAISGTVAEGYLYLSSRIRYTYDASTRGIFTADELAMSYTAYVPGGTEVTADGFTFSVSGGGATVTDYSGAGGAVTIPDSVTADGVSVPVTAIGDYAFSRCAAITAVTIPTSVTAIGFGAFNECSALAAADLPAGLTELGGYAFAYCPQLERASIPAGVSAIREAAFYACSSLTDLSIAEGVESIGDHVFRYCTDLPAVTLPSTVSSIGVYAFADCHALSAIALPAAVDTVSEGCFYGCWALETVDLASVTTIGSTAFFQCLYLETIAIPATVTAIERLAFAECVSLAALSVPGSVETIGSYAFAGCPLLADLTLADGLRRIESYAFSTFKLTEQETLGAAALTAVTFPASVDYIGDCAFASCESLASVTFLSGETLFSDDAFENTPWLAAQGAFVIRNGVLVRYQGPGGAVLVPDTVTGIGSYAFFGRTGITSVTLPASVTAIGDYAFYGCSKLSSIEAAGTIETLGDGAFWRTQWLEDQGDFAVISGILADYMGDDAVVTVPDTVTTINANAFSGCDTATRIVLPGTVTAVNDNAFYNCRFLQEVWLMGGRPVFGQRAFYGLNALVCFFGDRPGWEGEDYPDLAGEPIWYEFDACGQLYWRLAPWGDLLIFGQGDMPMFAAQSAVPWYSQRKQVITAEIAEGVTSIGKYAFVFCSNMMSVTIPDSVRGIGDYAFYECSSLSSVEIPAGVTAIDRYVFYKCAILQSLVIPAGVTSVGNFAFANSGLETVTFIGDAPAISDSAFTGVKATAGRYADASGWEDAENNYGGYVTWISLGARTITDAGGAVSVRRDDGGIWPEGIAVTVTPVSDAQTPPWPGELSVRKYQIYDITLAGGEPPSPVYVTVQRPRGYAADILVFRQEPDGDLTAMSAEYVGDGLAFATDHFSRYILAQPAPGALIPGDVTGDEQADMADAVMILQHAVGFFPLLADEIAAADVNGDGKADLADALTLARQSLGQADGDPLPDE